MLFTKIISKILKEHDITISLLGKDNFTIFDECAETGIDQGEMIARFEAETNMPFVDIMPITPDYAFIKKYGINRIQTMGVFPYKQNDFLYIAMSEPSKTDLLDSLSDKLEYIPVFCFDFLIDKKISDITDELDDVVEPVTAREVIEVNLDKQTILLATGQDSIDSIIESSPMFKDSLQIVDKIHKRELICDKCEELSPNILLVGDNVGGKMPLIKILLQVNSRCPNVRIIFLTGKVNSADTTQQMNLGLLASVGIYDLITDAEISVSKLQHVIDNPQTEKDVKQFIEKVKDSSGKKTSSEIKITVPTEIEDEDSVRVYQNVYTFISPHGAVGKSTIVQNLAIALDTYAMNNINGKKPKIGIIDLDVQGFSTSRFFDTLNKDFHIYTAIEETKKKIDPLGQIMELNKVENVEIHEKIIKSFVQTKKYKNIFVLGGDDKVYRKGDKDKMNSYYLTFIIEAVLNDFDIIFIDANTDIECSIPYPLYSMSSNIFNIMDVSTQCFNLNKRYLTFLEDASVYQPFNNKFILNKAFDLTDTYLTIKDIQKILNIDFKYIFPKIPDQKAFNMSCKNESIIASDDEDLKVVKMEFLEMANDIYPLKDYDALVQKLGVKPSQRFEKNVKAEPEVEEEKKHGFLESILSKKKSLLSKKPKKSKEPEHVNTDNISLDDEDTEEDNIE